MGEHEALHTPRTHEDGSLNHYQETLRLLALSEEVSQRHTEGAQYYATVAQVHATLHAADVEVETVKLMRSARIALSEQSGHPVSPRGKRVLSL